MRSFARLHPEESAWARLRLAQDTLYQKKNLADAAAMLEKAVLSAKPGGDIAKQVKDQLAWVCIETGNAPRAVELYKQLVAEYPKGNLCWWKTMMAEALSAQGQYDKAIGLCSEAQAPSV
jgi:tetratricopeptide (TPR) repeat protein